MQIGDLVKWTDIEQAYHIACRAMHVPDLSSVRSRGIIVDRNPIYYFVRWENHELIAQKPNTIEVISENR